MDVDLARYRLLALVDGRELVLKTASGAFDLSARSLENAQITADQAEPFQGRVSISITGLGGAESATYLLGEGLMSDGSVGAGPGLQIRWR